MNLITTFDFEIETSFQTSRSRAEGTESEGREFASSGGAGRPSVYPVKVGRVAATSHREEFG